MRHDPAGASIVIMLRSLKLYGMANAVEDLVAQGRASIRGCYTNAVAAPQGRDR